MGRSQSVGKIQQLEMQLDDAIHMLRLVAANKRTTVEVDEWLNLTYPDRCATDDATLAIFLNMKHGR